MYELLGLYKVGDQLTLQGTAPGSYCVVEVRYLDYTNELVGASSINFSGSMKYKPKNLSERILTINSRDAREVLWERLVVTQNQNQLPLTPQPHLSYNYGSKTSEFERLNGTIKKSMNRAVNCTCGVTSTFGSGMPDDAHSEWCEMLRKDSPDRV